MANPWFRLYHEFAIDPKVQMLSEKDQRRLIMLFCLRCCNGDVTFHDEEVAFQLRINNDEWVESKAIFVAKKFIDEHNRVLNWDKRQYVSDSSTARVRKHRETTKRQCNVSVTPPDTDTDTDKPPCPPKKVDEYSNEFLEFWKHYPKKKAKGAAWKAWKKIKRPVETLVQIQTALLWQKKSKDWTKEGGQYIPHPSTYLNAKGWEDEPQTGTCSIKTTPDWL